MLSRASFGSPVPTCSYAWRRRGIPPVATGAESRAWDRPCTFESCRYEQMRVWRASARPSCRVGTVATAPGCKPGVRKGYGSSSLSLCTNGFIISWNCITTRLPEGCWPWRRKITPYIEDVWSNPSFWRLQVHAASVRTARIYLYSL